MQEAAKRWVETEKNFLIEFDLSTLWIERTLYVADVNAFRATRPSLEQKAISLGMEVESAARRRYRERRTS